MIALIVFLVILTLLLISANIFSRLGSTFTGEETTQESTQESIQESTEFAIESEQEQKLDELFKKIEPETQEDPSATEEQLSALASAESYLSWAGLSEQALREQLSFEEFSQDAIDYAMENVDVDYNEQALMTAKNYAEWSEASGSEMPDQALID